MLHIFIINPYAGKQKFAEDIRKKLSEMNNLNYFVFNTRNAGYEKELVKRLCNIFEEEKLRFYCCGGSGTLRNIVSALGDNINKVEIAFYPCGHTNDYLKIFGNQEKLFYKLENLINGKTVDVDYIKANDGIALNSLTAGIDAIFMDDTKQNKELWNAAYAVANFISFVGAVFFTNFVKYHIEIDGKVHENAYIELIIANGTTFGGVLQFAKSSRINDGIAHFVLVPYANLLRRVSFLKYMYKGKKLEKIKEISEGGLCQKVVVRRQDNKPFYMNYDGELVEGTEFNIEVVKKGLKMVVPKEVTIDG